MCSFDTERFIIEVASRPVLWNQAVSEYTNKHLKIKAWEDVASIMYTDYEQMDAKLKTDIHTSVTRKWKSLRDSFMRELNLQVNKTSGSERPIKKPYVYFNQLSFLRSSLEKRKTTSKIGLTPDENSLQLQQNLNVTEDEAVNSNVEDGLDDGKGRIDVEKSPKSHPLKLCTRPASVICRKKNQDAVIATELKILQSMSKIFEQNIQPTQTTTHKEEDPDKLFLLSLVGEIKKVHDDDRLDMKAELLGVVSKWKRMRQNTVSANQTTTENIETRPNVNIYDQQTFDIIPMVQSPSIINPSSNDKTNIISPGSSDNASTELC